MRTSSQFVITAAAIAVFAASAVMAQQSSPRVPGAGMHNHGSTGHEPMMRQGMGGGMGRGPVGMLTVQDANSATDMGVTMNLVHENTKIRRTVTRLPDGFRTVTESDDPKTSRDIKAHVASMSGRLDEDKEFNIFSTTLPVIFDNAKNIKSRIEFTAKGVIVTRTSPDPKTVAALQAHADEVAELVKEGPVAFHRGIDAHMTMGPGRPRGAGAGTAGQGRQHQHAH
jgi:hypothetical protein